MLDTIDLRGTLSRRIGRVFKRWKKSTYVLRNRCLLEFSLGANPFGSVPLRLYPLLGSYCVDASPVTSKPEVFRLNFCNGSTILLRASSAAEKSNWMATLRQAASPYPPTYSEPTLPIAESFPAQENESEDEDDKNDVEFIQYLTSDASSSRSSSILDSEELESSMILQCLETFVDAVIVWHASGVVVQLNISAQKMFGVSNNGRGMLLAHLLREPTQSTVTSAQSNNSIRQITCRHQSGTKFLTEASFGALPTHGYFLATLRYANL